MPPAISDEDSDFEEMPVVPIPVKQQKRATAVQNNDEQDGVDSDEDEDMLDAAKGEIADEGEDEEDEDLDEDEFVVEKIVGHVLQDDGTIKYQVKWEGWDKKSDLTFEEEENLRENASAILDGYLLKVGGRDRILSETKAALQTKKRGRPSAGIPQSNSTTAKRSKRNDGHPASATPPASAQTREPKFKVPAGSWEEAVESIDACHDENTGKLIVYLTWKGGVHKTQHGTKVVYARCPQKMLQFYEQHVKIVKVAPSDTES